MSQATYSRGRFSQRNLGRYEAAQAVKSSDDDEKFVVDEQPNRVDTVQFLPPRESSLTLSRQGIRALERFSCAGSRSSTPILRDLSHSRQEKRWDMTTRDIYAEKNSRW